MFPAIERDLSKNQLFQSWKKKSVSEQLLGEPKILQEEFSSEWFRKLKNVIGDGPLTSRFLANLAEYIQCIQGLDGYDNIKKRLEKVDEGFYPVVSEIEFIYFLLLKTSSSCVHLECTFDTERKKHPELKVDYNSGSAFFEVTSVQDYKEMGSILQYFNILTALQLSIKTIYNLRRKIVIEFSKYPTEKMFVAIYKMLNKKIGKKGTDAFYPILFQEETDDYRLTFSEGNEVIFDLPTNLFEKKIKEKLDEETRHFDVGKPNYIVLDVTPIVLKMSSLEEKVREYFRYTQNKTVWGVLLMSNRWTFKNLEPAYKICIAHQASPLIDTKRSLDIVSGLLPQKIY